MKSISVPGSKNISLRALFVAGFANGKSEVSNLAESDDIEVAKRALVRLGARVEGGTVTGVNGAPQNPGGVLDLDGSGVSMRFLSAIAVLAPGEKTLDGNARMRQRPIKELVNGLRQLGVDASCAETGCPPVRIQSQGIGGGAAEMDGSQSSQYFSALALAAPYAKSDVVIRAKGELVSEQFLRETLSVMSEFGVKAEYNGKEIRVPAPRQYQTREYIIPGDWAATSYWMAYAALHQTSVALEGLDLVREQADKAIMQAFTDMGCAFEERDGALIVTGKPLKAITVEDGSLVDSAITVMAVAPFAEGTTVLRNIAHLRLKESDRIAEMAKILRTLGAGVKEYEDGIAVTCAKSLKPAEIDPANDHRIAMALGVVGTKVPGVRVLNPECATKSYPAFWEELERVHGKAQR